MFRGPAASRSTAPSEVGRHQPSVAVKQESSSGGIIYSQNKHIDQGYAKGMCRCCLLEGTFESMESKNMTSGFAQSYMEMLQATLGLTLVSTQLPRLICSSCAIQLRQALAFRKQVTTAEKAFITQYVKMVEVKVEADSTDANPAEISEAGVSTDHLNDIKPDIDDDKVIISLDDDNYNEDMPLSTFSLMKSCADAIQQFHKTHNKYENEDNIDDDAVIVDAADDKEDKKFEKCDICNERHAPDTYAQCKFCEHVFLNTRDKVYHAKCDTSKCSFCNENFYNYNNKHNHLMKHCKYILCLRKRLQTPVADENVSEDSAAKIERLEIASIKLVTGKFYKCEICKTDHSFEEIKEKHANYQKYICTLCKVLFCDELKKEHHCQNHHVHCHLCNIILPAPNKKKSHMNLKHGFKCVICGDRIVGKSKDKHNSELHGAKVYHCGICNRDFYLEHMLVKHQRMVHMKEKNIKCSKCDLEFYSAYYLTKHMVSHSKKKIYQCEYCSKKFCRKSTLQFHIRIHTGDRRAVCKICGEAFVQRASLKYHLEKYHPGDFY